MIILKFIYFLKDDNDLLSVCSCVIVICIWMYIGRFIDVKNVDYIKFFGKVKYFFLNKIYVRIKGI